MTVMKKTDAAHDRLVRPRDGGPGAIRRVRVLAAAAAAGVLAGCAASPRPLPLQPEPIPYADTLPIPEPPEQVENQELRVLLFHTPYEMAEPFRVPEGESLNRTHFDDVVSSAWFERRMGYVPLSPGELARGSAPPEGAPSPTGALIVKEAKTQGVTPGFTLEDEKGDTYIVKFDTEGIVGLQTSAGVITNRLMWGAGYHVPSDYLLVFDSTRLEVEAEATLETDEGERPMTQEDLAAVLSETAPGPDGRYVALASKFVPGIPKGATFFHGTREDDPNDHYRHEYRRELRGLRVISSWVNNTDLREGNTMDVYVEPGYLRHYVIDFGATLGSGSTRPKHPKDEREQPASFWNGVARILTLGLYEEGWEDDPWHIPHPSLGYLRGESFDPEGWNAHWENPAFFAMTPADAYWAAKIVAAFTDEHIRAAVLEGGLPEPWTVDTLVAKLVVRRDILVRHWYGEVTPLEEPAVEASGPGGLTLAFRDLGLEEGLWADDETTYRWSFEHDALELDGEGSAAARGRGRQTFDIAWKGDAAGRGLDGRDALAALRVRADRPGTDARAATVWLRWTGTGYEVVGLEH